MFRKIVTDLTYSPAVAGELTAYIKRLRQEKNKRQIGLVFVALALIIQIFASLLPPESANAGDSSAFIPGGVQSIDTYLDHYDRNVQHSQDFLTSLGITRADIASSAPGTVEPTKDLTLWTLADNPGGTAVPYRFATTEGDIRTAHHQSFTAKDTRFRVLPKGDILTFTGSSSSIGWFAVLQSSGNLITKNRDPSACIVGAAQSITTQEDTIECHQALEPTLSARNLSADSETQPANASDRIMYTLSLKNTGTSGASVPLSIELRDIMEYGYLLDKGGGDFDESTNTLHWQKTDVAPGNSITRNFIIKLMPTIPATARGEHNAASYDCMMSASFGTTVTTPVACPFTKTIERATDSLPYLSARSGLVFIAGIAAIALYFYARSRQLLAELNRIQHGHTGGI